MVDDLVLIGSLDNDAIDIPVNAHKLFTKCSRHAG
jgi:hypothetical protein